MKRREIKDFNDSSKWLLLTLEMQGLKWYLHWNANKYDDLDSVPYF